MTDGPLLADWLRLGWLARLHQSPSHAYLGPERPGGRAAERSQECPSSDVTCHVTLRLGVIHAMEG
jgi:hypothetical protein